MSKKILIQKNGDKYEGEFYQGKKHGKGVFTEADGNVYDGEYLYDK